jgi:hypothetical protein
MSYTTIALLLLTASATGCSAAKSAMGLLSPKPAQVTVVNTIAPAPVVVTVQSREPPPSKAHTGRATAMVVGGAAGALFGGLLGKALDRPVVPAAAIGGGVGAVTGLIVHELED